MTTTPSETAIRAACAEAGIDPNVLGQDGYHWSTWQTILALARRIGKLVLIGDDAVERMVTAMRNVPSWDGSLIVSDAALTDDELRDLATAALAALTGEG
jgi:hypothetical protein